MLGNLIVPTDKIADMPHLFLDADGIVYDKHIEDMFNELFRGDPIDGIFKTNFEQYLRVLTGQETVVPEEVYSNTILAKKFILATFGAIKVEPATDYDKDGDPDYEHCTHVGILAHWNRDYKPKYCFAPSEHYAVLLCAIDVYRFYARQFNDKRWSPGNFLPA